MSIDRVGGPALVVNSRFDLEQEIERQFALNNVKRDSTSYNLEIDNERGEVSSAQANIAR